MTTKTTKTTTDLSHTHAYMHTRTHAHVRYSIYYCSNCSNVVIGSGSPLNTMMYLTTKLTTFCSNCSKLDFIGV